MSRAAVTVAMLFAVVAGCASSASSVPGTLPGEAHGAVHLTEAMVTSDSVATDGSPSSRSGNLTTVRYSMGGYFALTRFGALSGIEGTVAAGWLTGDAAQLESMSEAKHLYFENEVGGVIVPLPMPAAFRISGDFGVGYTLDDRYTYAGGRLLLVPSRSFAFDGKYRRHFGDTPGNDGAHEDRFSGCLSFKRSSRKSAIQIGFDYVRGDQRTLANGVEMPRTDYLLRGRYEMFAVTLGIGFPSPNPKLSSVR